MLFYVGVFFRKLRKDAFKIQDLRASQFSQHLLSIYISILYTNIKSQQVYKLNSTKNSCLWWLKEVNIQTFASLKTQSWLFNKLCLKGGREFDMQDALVKSGCMQYFYAGKNIILPVQEHNSLLAKIKVTS